MLPLHVGRVGGGARRSPVGALTPYAPVSVGDTPAKMSPAPLTLQKCDDCVGHAFIGAVWTFLMHSGQAPAFTGSQAWAYLLSRCVDRTLPPVPSIRPPLTDSGTSVYSCATAARLFGIHAQGPATDNTDSNPTTVNIEPNLGALVTAFDFRVAGLETITSFGAQRVLDMRAALDANHPLIVVIEVDEQFDNYNGTTPIGTWDSTKIYVKGTSSRGLHCIYLYDYRVDANGKVIFKGRNSWGLTWGLSGDFELDEDGARTLAEVNPVVPMKVAE